MSSYTVPHLKEIKLANPHILLQNLMTVYYSHVSMDLVAINVALKQ